METLHSSFNKQKNCAHEIIKMETLHSFFNKQKNCAHEIIKMETLLWRRGEGCKREEWGEEVQ